MRPLLAPALGFVLATSVLLAGSAHAGFYGDYVGSTVTFEDVQDQNDLFGAPTVSADSLDFNPNTFETGCTSAPCGASLVDDTLTFTIQANAGQFIDDIVLTEAGDFNLSTFLPDDLSVTSVSANVVIDIFEIDGVAVNNINAQAAMVFTNAGAFSRSTSADGVGTSSGGWSGSLTIDLDSIIAGTTHNGRATRVTLNINNTLTAFGGNGNDPNGATAALAFIEKKDFDGLAVTVVPEPGTAILMGLGLAGLATIRRERRNTLMM